MPETKALQLQAYILKIREDALINSAFVYILTPNNYIEVKFPTKIENYKYKPLVNFGNLLQLDLIKTRKHWIVTHIENTNRLNYATWSYSQFELLTEMNKILCENLHIDQDCHLHDLLHYYLELLNQKDFQNSKTFLVEFTQSIKVKLGFEN